MSNRSNERAAIPSFGTEVGSGRHRARTALLSGALVVALVIAAVVAWRVVNRHAGTATVKGTVTSVDPSASTLTVMPAEHVASAAGCADRSNNPSPNVACPAAPPLLRDVTVDTVAATRIRRCTTEVCAAAAFADIKAGQTVIVVGSTTALAVSASSISIVAPTR